MWTDYVFTSAENQEILFLPTNSISDTIGYVSTDNSNQRMIIDIPNYGDENWTPNTWVVSKIERANVRGRTKVTLAQETFDPHNDYIEKDKNGNIIGMWANYFDTNEEPLDTEKREDMTLCVNCAKISSSTSTVKIGGSYKTLSVNIFNDKNEDITDSYSDATFEWNCSIGGNDYTYDVENIKWMDGNLFNQKKIKFLNNKDYLKRTIEVKCSIIKYNQTIESIISFELVV